ncbi:CoA-disulfide reductase [Candidatus Chrysopegis kryptomonas]|uniref:NADPH-dependent 2,4-dienoyl-CoA reductase, sulfur reductase n=1 Tax=Candidatus Chryseopegocella kryptomonas TaxID=1633643 RepID=A0A0P1NWB7_9BACT|nr:CoA-disulfide reductase [Candidatus Chrysopegis kryptomonas]CUT03700.1 NADPH-dependent 2,4-dienoyl-CoA reductase, sulfur reductase [Candidatus Chrysopegis kryptomonas]
MTERLVVIGGVAAGMSAASRARRLRPDLEILVFEKSGFVSYGSCGLPYFVSDIIKAPENLVVYDAKFFKEKRNIDVFTHHEALKIFPAKRTLLVKNLENDKEFEVQYDKLVIATGARAVRPNVKGVDLKGIFTIRFLEDGIEIKSFIKENSPRKALIVGAGYIGMEMAESLVSVGMDVLIVEQMPNILGTMDDEINEVVEQELQRNGVKLLKSTSVDEFIGENGYVRKAKLSNGEIVDAELVLIGAGIKPNSEIAKEAGIEIGRTGAIAVNQRMETNISGIYSAGDCAEAFHLVLNRPVYIPLGTTANKQGKVAGENAAGGNAIFKGIVGTAVFKVFDLEVARTGLSEKQAKAEGFDYVSTVIEHGSRAHYYPGGSKIRVKLIADRKTGRLLGAEMVGRDGVAKRIDVFATALHAKLTIDEIGQLDLSYAPPFAPVWDPVLIAANDLEKKIKK